MATGIPEVQEGFVITVSLALGVSQKQIDTEGVHTWCGNRVVCGRGGQTQVTGTH